MKENFTYGLMRGIETVHDSIVSIPTLRYMQILTQIAYSSITNSIWAREYYNKKRNEGKSHRHALRCLATRGLKIIFAM